MPNLFRLEYHNDGTTSVEYAEAHIATVKAYEGERTPRYCRVETRVVIHENIPNVHTPGVIEPLLDNSHWVSDDEDQFLLTPDALRTAAEKMREAIETASEDEDVDEDVIAYVVGVLEEALAGYKDAQGATYTILPVWM